MADRVFIFHETTDNFRAFDFAGAAQVSENWTPGFTEVRGAAANRTHIYVLDVSVDPAIVRRFRSDQTRESANDITMDKAGTYEGIALTDTHLVAIKGETLEYYSLSTGAYDATRDVTLPSQTSGITYAGIARQGSYLYIITENTVAFQPIFYKRNLDGSAVSAWNGPPSTTALTVFATRDFVAAIRKNGGHWDRYNFEGVAQPVISTIGGGVWAASYTTFEPPAVLSIEAIDEQFIAVGTEDYDLVIDIGGNPDTAKATGHIEGFGQHWDAVNGQLHIKSEEVTRLITGVNWDIELVKGVETLMGQVAYNVVHAAPIFASLGTIHLYRGVPINFDIIIQNIPPLLIPDAELLGLKSELLEFGIKVIGEISETDSFAFSSGNVTIIVPSDSGGADTRYDYPYEIEIGRPPEIVSPVFRPKGGYGELEFADVTHALGYEWTLAEGDADVVDWSVFDSTRQVINPDQVDVRYGNLEVTIKFPNIAGASSYAYKLESENHEVDWKAFTGTLADGFITTIIPDLQEDAEYTLRLRVASPWIGAPVSIKVYGGRLVYTVHDDNANSILMAVNTGQAPNDRNQTAQAIKRFFLPTGLEAPDALAIDGDTVYCYDDHATLSEKAIYMFSLDTVNDQRATVIKKFKLPVISALTSFSVLRDIFYFDGRLYVFQGLTAAQSGLTYSSLLYTVDPAATANNATATVVNGWGLVPGDRHVSNATAGLSISEPFIRTVVRTRGNYFIETWDRTPLDYSSVPSLGRKSTGLTALSEGDILGDKVYVSLNSTEMRILDLASEEATPPVVKSFRLPHNRTPTGLVVGR